MRRKERTRALVEGNPILARTIARQVELQSSVDVLEDPREALVMVKARESARRQLFYLGEALVTSCRVRVDGVQGQGLVMGDDRGLAYDLALIDAAWELGEEKFPIAKWEDSLSSELRRIERRQAREREVNASTRVDFSTMSEEL